MLVPIFATFNECSLTDVSVDVGVLRISLAMDNTGLEE